MQRFWLILILVLVAVVATSVFFMVFSHPGRVGIKINLEYHEPTYSICEGSLQFSVTTAQTELNHDVMSYGSNAKTILEQLQPLKELLLAIKKREGRIPHTLFWQSHQSYSEFYGRVATAAAVPIPGEVTSYVMKIANEKKLYQEIEKLFAELGFTIKVSGVEKVVLDLPTNRPADFMLWFKLGEGLK